MTVCTYKKITSDERQRMLIQAREDAWRDEEARKKADIEDAFKDGKKEGIIESKIQIAKKAINMGLDTQNIIEFTGLSENDLENLR